MESLGRWLTWPPSASTVCLFCLFLTVCDRILGRRGYTYHIDWWSLGVCAYELIFGRRPFRGRSNADLTKSITMDSIRWPEDTEKRCSKNGVSVLRAVSVYSLVLTHSRTHYFLLTVQSYQFLERDPAKRLGCRPNGEGFLELKRHPWFATIDWETLETKEQVPPFTPDVSCPPDPLLCMELDGRGDPVPPPL